MLDLIRAEIHARKTGYIGKKVFAQADHPARRCVSDRAEEWWQSDLCR